MAGHSTSDDSALNRAARFDAEDPLRRFREQFHIPRQNGTEMAYFCGNSLGLQPKSARTHIDEAMEKWSTQAVEGHFLEPAPWMPYHQLVRDGLAQIVGAQASEVVAMNSLTANLHLMMVSFFRPSTQRNMILMEAGAFPSDRHAVASQLEFHGLSAKHHLIELAPDREDGTFSMTVIEAAIDQYRDRLALILWPGVQYRTGQAFDLHDIVRLGHAAGATVGFDLAHAVGNLPLRLHDSGADFAVWCHYKYMNAGPGAVAGCFVHERHAYSDRPRFAGWWGHDQASRFKMGPEFVPIPGADGWQLSNPPILGLAPLRASLELFAQAGMSALREKSIQLTGMLDAEIRTHFADTLQIVTPADRAERGCQLSLRVLAGRGLKGRDAGRSLFEFLAACGVLGDWREPDVIRISPAPLYNTYRDVLRFVHSVEEWRA
jgi:kynureninase